MITGGRCNSRAYAVTSSSSHNGPVSPLSAMIDPNTSANDAELDGRADGASELQRR